VERFKPNPMGINRLHFKLSNSGALRNITADWGRAAREWREAMNQFAILYDERFTLPAQAGR